MCSRSVRNLKFQKIKETRDMKKLFIIFLAVLICSSQLSAQRHEKKVLVLLPFHVENSGRPETIKNESDIYSNKSYEMFGFWEGAQLALEPYNKDYVKIKVIVRDVNTNEEKLQSILDELKDEQIDLIIGPLFGKPFALAAEYAKEHHIPIVNPFSNRSDFLEDNPYVYKLIPSLEPRPQTLDKLLLSKLDNYNLIFWTNESSKTKDQPYYEIYFTNKGIEYKTVALNSGFQDLKKAFEKNKKNVIVALFDNASVAIIQQLQNLALLADTSITLVAPESWLDIKNVGYNYLNQLNFHFFTNYFIDKNDPAVKLFADEYITKFSSYPDVTRFSYQGYDITSYFISLLINNFDFSKVDTKPLSFEFDFDNEKGNGYENRHQRLIRMEDFQLKEVK